MNKKSKFKLLFLFILFAVNFTFYRNSFADSSLLIVSEFIDPIAPTNLSCSVNGSAVTLDWDAPSGATGYNFKWGSFLGNYPNSIPFGNVTPPQTYTEVPRAAYYLVLTATNCFGESSESNWAKCEVTELLSVPDNFCYEIGDCVPSGFSSSCDVTLEFLYFDRVGISFFYF